MTVAEAQNLKPGDIVWMTYCKSKSEGFRMDEAVEVMTIEGNNISFDCADFDIDTGIGLEKHASNFDYGEEYLYHAVEKK